MRVLIFIFIYFSFFSLEKQCEIYPNEDCKSQEDTISTRTMLNLHNADPDQLEDYLNVIYSNIYDILDVDLRKTSDGIWINVHDEILNGIEIKTHTYKEICTANPKNTPISFEQFLKFAVQNDVILQIEDKTSPTDNLPELKEIVNKYNALDLVFVSSNSYKILDESLNSFNNIMIFDVWEDDCTESQALKLYEKASKKGGKVILNSSIKKNNYLSPEEVIKYSNLGFLIEIGFNHTPGTINDYLDFFNTYNIRYVNTIKIDNPTYGNFRSAFRKKYGIKSLKP